MWSATAACDRPPPGPSEPERAAAKVDAPPPLPAPDLTLLVLTDPRGYLEPCGCQQRPLGGVDKLAHTVARVRGEGRPVLLLAAGNLYFGAELHGSDAEGASTQERWKAETLAGIWKDVGVSAVAPGPLDFSMGPKMSAGLRELGGFPWLSENLEGVQPALGKAQLVEVGGRRVGLLASHASTGVPAWPQPVRAPEPAGLKDTVAALRSQGAELVVGLHYGDRRSARELTRAGADLVLLGGLDEAEALPPTGHGAGHVLHAGRQGQGLVRVDVSLGTGPLIDASEWSIEAQRAQLRAQAASLKSKIDAWEKDARVNAADLNAQKARLSELRRRADALRRPSPGPQGWFAARLLELDPDVPGDPQIAARMDAHDARVNEHNRVALADRKPAPVLEGDPRYLGSRSCGACHAAAARWWEDTAHGRAYATLQRVHKEYNLSCVGCHVTGYNEPGGSTVTHVRSLENVGCESCHGPGSQHAEQPDQPGRIARDVPQRVCGQCHTPDHSARFEYDAFRQLLIAPGHGLPAASDGERHAP